MQSINKHSPFRSALAAALLCALVIAVAGCGGSGSAQYIDILSQKVTPGDRNVVTVLVKYAFTIDSFEKAVEEKFPDIDLVQVGNYTGDMGIDEYYARLEHDDLTDVVMTWPLEVGEEFWADRLLDLSGHDFSSRYNLSVLGDISRGGKLYYVPGPAQVRGIVYNKTLFEENNWSVPKDFQGFINLCQAIDKSGIRALQLGLANSEVLNTAFVGYGFADCYSSPQDAAWIKEYGAGAGSLGDHFVPALDTFQRLVDEKILRPGDLEIGYAQREKMLFNRECAMVEDSVLMARMGYEYNGNTDEFALMPFFNPGNESDWARLYMVCYIGLNKHLAEPADKDQYDRVLRLMDYISTSQGQDALMADTGAMYSNLIGKAPPHIPEIRDLLPALSEGRYGAFPTLKNAQAGLEKGLAGLVRGSLTKEEVIVMTDAQNLSPPVAVTPIELGTASEDFTLLETGNFITDTLLKESGCDVALFMDNGKDGRYNGKGVSATIYAGPVTGADIKRILPDMKQGEAGVLCKGEMTGAKLLDTLEHALRVDNSAGGWFYYFSGLKMKFDPTAEPGSRIKEIHLADGEKIDPDRVYTVAAMDATLPEKNLISNQQTERLISDILAEAIWRQKTIAPSRDGRFAVVHP